MFKMPDHIRRDRARALSSRVLALLLFLGCHGSAWAAGPVTNASLASFTTALAGGGNVTLSFDNGTIVTSNTFLITTDTVIDASGRLNVAISGSGSTNRLFDVAAGVTFTINNVTLTGGKSFGNNGVSGANGANDPNVGNPGANGGNGANGLGGAIRNLGTSILINCTFTNNSAVGGAGGNGGNGGTGDFRGGDGGSGGNGGAGNGGAIYNSGTILLTNCTFAANNATGGSAGLGGTNGSAGALKGNGGAGNIGAGAGLYNLGAATVINCVFYNHAALGGSGTQAGNRNGASNGNDGQKGADALGGGICNFGTDTVINCTFFGNQVKGGNGGNGGNGDFTAGKGGNGGNGFGGGLYSTVFVGVTNCTFSGNGANGGTNGVTGTVGNPSANGSPGLSRGDNISNNGGTFRFKNSILAQGSNGVSSFGTIIDQGNNISSDGSPIFTQMGSALGSFNNLGPKLAALANNGGPTLTMALLTNSPAINAGDDAAALPFDQRGAARLGRSDIGAFESAPLLFTISGQITAGTAPLAGVTIATDSSSTLSDANGNYTLVNLVAGSHTVTPQPVGFFNPTNRIITVPANATGINFTAITNIGTQTVVTTTNQTFQIAFQTLPNLTNLIQASTDLTNWQTIATNVAGTNGIWLFTDPSTNFPARFFRAVVP
ncbi:MAG: Cna domain protein [Pedosphaera sp.]|nr:Cna domain protein [Pedosphaera sp.]